MADDIDGSDARGERARYENVIEPYVRIPRRHRHARIAGVSGAERVDVPSLDDGVNRYPLDTAAAQPYERPQPRRQPPHVEIFPWRERVEVAGQHVEAMLMRGNRREPRAQFGEAAPARSTPRARR